MSYAGDISGHKPFSFLKPLGYQQITDASSATGLTVPNKCSVALINIEGDGARWRDDGTSPTSSVGMKVEVGDFFMYSGDLSAIEFFEDSTATVINVSYYGKD